MLLTSLLPTCYIIKIPVREPGAAIIVISLGRGILKRRLGGRSEEERDVSAQVNTVGVVVDSRLMVAIWNISAITTGHAPQH